MASDTNSERIQALKRSATQGLVDAFGVEATFWAIAPGRVNLIGEHTDYNDGFVMPAAIDRNVVIAARPREDRIVRINAIDLDSTVEFSLDDIQYDSEKPWSNYERGVAKVLQDAGYVLQGVDMALTSDIPVASGLSSSAAMEVGTTFVFQSLSDFELDGVKRALLCQRAENEFVGMRCGIMDQYIVSLGKQDYALLIDCRSLGYELVPVPQGHSVVICNTKAKRGAQGLVDSEYNKRREECETAAEILGVKALRDVTPEMFEEKQSLLAEVTRMRCRHVVTEDQRVMDSVAALQAGDITKFGELMNDSHVSLRDDYEVSCTELDAMVEAAWHQEGVIGARMTGGGFGGCAVALVKADAVKAFAATVAQEYTAATSLVPEIYVCQPSEGVHQLA